MSRRGKANPNLCGWCGERVRWATDDVGQRIPLDLGTVTDVEPRYVVTPGGNVDYASRLPAGSDRPGHRDHRNRCRTSVPATASTDPDDEPRTRRDLD